MSTENDQQLRDSVKLLRSGMTSGAKGVKGWEGIILSMIGIYVGDPEKLSLLSQILVFLQQYRHSAETLDSLFSEFQQVFGLNDTDPAKDENDLSKMDSNRTV